jgi:HEPN domain-containing protein
MGLTSNPDARAYYLVARQRLEEAEILLNNKRANGSIYLAGFAVECALKSLIMANTTGRERDQVRDRLKVHFGHDLESLRIEAGRRGVHMPQELHKQFRLLNTWDNNTRYSPKIQFVKDALPILRAATAVVGWVESVGGKRHG